MLEARDKWKLQKLFQSAPDREVGRCVAVRVQARHLTKFQSAPDREVGRCVTWVL